MPADKPAEVEMSRDELIKLSRIYADRECPGWEVGAITIWLGKCGRPKSISFTRGQSHPATVRVSGRALKRAILRWADRRSLWRGCAVAFRVGPIGELPTETLVVRNPRWAQTLNS